MSGSTPGASATRGLAFNATVTVLAFGLSPFFKKLAIEQGSDPWMVALGTVVVAAAVTLGVALAQRRELVACLFGARNVAPLALVGVLATGLVTLLVSYALSDTTATNRSLFQAAYPAATLVFAHAMLGERLRGLQYAGVLVIMGGLVLANGVEGPLRFGTGFWLLALTLPLIGFSDTLAKRLTGRFAPLVLASGRNFYGALFIVSTALVLDLGPWPDAAQAGWIALAGALQGAGIWSLYRALQTSKASLVSSVIAAAPLVTVVVEQAFLGLVLQAWQWAGIFIVIASAAWLTRSE